MPYFYKTNNYHIIRCMKASEAQGKEYLTKIISVTMSIRINQTNSKNNLDVELIVTGSSLDFPGTISPHMGSAEHVIKSLQKK